MEGFELANNNCVTFSSKKSEYLVLIICETELMNGALEPTNQPYAIAKIAGIKMCESYNRHYGRVKDGLVMTNNWLLQNPDFLV